MTIGRTCETCDLAPCVRRKAQYDVTAAMNGGISENTHECYYLKETGFDSQQMLGNDELSYVSAMVKFYKAEILRCIENSNHEALINHERSLSDMLVKRRKIITDTGGGDNTRDHQKVLKELFPEVEIVK